MPMLMIAPLAGFTHRRLAHPKFTPMLGVHISLEKDDHFSLRCFAPLKLNLMFHGRGRI